MKTRLALIFVAFVGVLVWYAVPTAQAQPAVVELSDQVTAVAETVVNGTVISTTDVEINGMPHRVSHVSVSTTLEGTEVSGEILVEVPGGQRADGTGVFVSHTANLVAGAEVQLALQVAEPLMQSVLPVALELDAVAYSIVGGNEGAANLLPLGGAIAAATGDFSHGGLSWPNFDSPLQFWINPAASGLSSSETISGVLAGFNMWEADPLSDVDFAYAGTTSATGVNFNDNRVTVSWVNSGASWLGQAWLEYDNSGRIYEFDIQMNRRYNWSNGASQSRFDIASTVGHEVGHGLGFDHVGARSELMYDTIFAGTTKGLGPGDLSGVRAIYPQVYTGPVCNGEPVTVNLQTGEGKATNGRDVILGTNGGDWIYGWGGNDLICGGLGVDRIFGGQGDDVIFGDGGSDLIFGQAGADEIHGGSGADKIYGGTASDTIFGNGGQDSIWGEDGNDEIQGNWESDKIYGGDGNDTLRGAGGKDKLYGEAGNDHLYGGVNTDYLNGGSGSDYGDGQQGRDKPLVPGVSGCEFLSSATSC